MSDTIDITVKDRVYSLDRTEFTDPRVSVLRILRAANDGNFDELIDLPSVLELEERNWRRSDLMEFLEKFGEILQEELEMDVPESSGSVTSSRSIARKSSTSASELD
ncbi:hypothetical protein [Acidipropionibacterium timonense]|uniref:hypothetical protein n=1 Tax=Acidipropionibacterium timonense TaxID=2161818 RepID=UPI00102F8E9A|nr:hypothetical protein [Acidipropionibacterium timonense]